MRALDYDLHESQLADQATGCRGCPEGQLYDSSGNKLTDEEAAELFLDEQLIEAPNAGAGSYRGVMERLGVTVTEVLEQSSSAGDWTLLTDKGIVFQHNRYQYHGFSYALDRHAIPWEP